LADRAAVALVLVCAVAHRSRTGEVVPLHDAGEASALAGAGDVDELAILAHAEEVKGKRAREALLREADMLPYEKVDIYDITNGNRLQTYVIEGEPGSGVICINGAAAHLIKPGDLVIICSYVQVDEAEARGWKGGRILLDADNRPVH